jgi:hypothetical protein
MDALLTLESSSFVELLQETAQEVAMETRNVLDVLPSPVVFDDNSDVDSQDENNVEIDDIDEHNENDEIQLEDVIVVHGQEWLPCAKVTKDARCSKRVKSTLNWPPTLQLGLNNDDKKLVRYFYLMYPWNTLTSTI